MKMISRLKQPSRDQSTCSLPRVFEHVAKFYELIHYRRMTKHELLYPNVKIQVILMAFSKKLRYHKIPITRSVQASIMSSFKPCTATMLSSDLSATFYDKRSGRNSWRLTQLRVRHLLGSIHSADFVILQAGGGASRPGLVATFDDIADDQ
jgi:hypothetical protein